MLKSDLNSCYNDLYNCWTDLKDHLSSCRFSLYYSGLSCVYMFLRKGDMKSARLLMAGIAIYLTKLSICVALTGRSKLHYIYSIWTIWDMLIFQSGNCPPALPSNYMKYTQNEPYGTPWHLCHKTVNLCPSHHLDLKVKLPDTLSVLSMGHHYTFVTKLSYLCCPYRQIKFTLNTLNMNHAAHSYQGPT